MLFSGLSHFLLTNFSVIIWQQIVLVPLFDQVVVNRDHFFICNPYKRTNSKNKLHRDRQKAGKKEYIDRSNILADSCNRGGMKKSLCNREV